MDGGNRHKRRCVDGIGDAVDSLDEFAQVGGALLAGKRQGPKIEFLQVSAGAKAPGARTGEEARAGGGRKAVNRGCELLQFAQHQRPDFVQWFVVKSEFQNAVTPFPAQCLAAKFLYRLCPAARLLHTLLPTAAAFFRYICSISPWNFWLMASRFSLPLAVSKPLSGVNASGRRAK